MNQLSLPANSTFTIGSRWNNGDAARWGGVVSVADPAWGLISVVYFGVGVDEHFI